MRSMNSAQKEQIENVAPEAEAMAKKKPTTKTATMAELDSDDEPLGVKTDLPAAGPSTTNGEASKGKGQNGSASAKKRAAAEDSDLSSDEEALGAKVKKQRT